MRRHLFSAALVFLTALSAVAVVGAQLQSAPRDAGGQAGVPRRLKVLFLGDDGHHVPLERCRQVFTAMARRGVSPEINAISTIIVVVFGALIIVSEKVRAA